MSLDPLTIVLLVVLGMFTGAMSAVIGGASIITFPALIALGLTPVEAAITILVSLMPSGFAAAYYDRGKLPDLDRSLIILILTSVVFAAVGAALLLITPLEVFKLLVPVLLAVASVLFAYAPRIARRLTPPAGAATKRAGARWRTSTLGMIPVAVYTGYFGAGVGVMLLAVLPLGTGGDYRTANAVKNLLIGLNNVFATTVYAIAGAILWPVVGIMVIGTLVGAWIGTGLAKVVPRKVIRVIVIFLGFALTAVYAHRFWVAPLTTSVPP